MTNYPVSGYIYFIEYNNMIKIGKTQDYLKRLKQFATTMPLEMVIVWAIIPVSNMHEYEKYYHNRYANYRINNRNEWFSKEILRFRGPEW